MSSIVVNGKTYIQTKAKRIDWIEVGQVLGACALIFLWLAYNAEKSVTSAFNFEGIPSDGPFQLYNPLRRIAAGQTGGVDFQYFHGIGIPYLHYPLYWLFGKTFVASELSRYLVTLLCSVVSLVFFAYASVPRAKKTLYFIAFAVCAFSLTDFINVYWLPRVVHDYAMVNPRVSLMGVRAAFPILVFAVFVSKIRPSIKPFILGFSLALSFFFGIDHGTAVIGGFVAISALAIGQSLLALTPARKLFKGANPEPAAGPYWKSNSVFALTTLATAIGGIIVLYLLAGGLAGGMHALAYNFREVPADQFWYFGVDPNWFVGGGNIKMDAYIYKWLTITAVSAVIFLILLVNCFRRYPIELSKGNTLVAATFILSYGMIACVSCLGYFNTGYFTHLPRLVLLITLMAAIRGEWASKASGFIKQRPQVRSLRWAGIALVCTLFALAILTMFQGATQQVSEIASIAQRTPAARLSGGWMRYMQTATTAVDSHRRDASKPPVIWSTYANLLESHYGVFNPSDDYIIQALGPKRRDLYLQRFREAQPEFVQTMRETITTVSMFPMLEWDYEEWLRTTTWPMYEDLLNNYDVVTTTGHSVIWQHKQAPWVQPDESWTKLPLSPGATNLSIPENFTDGESIVVVKLDYTINNPWKRLPVFGGLPRYLVEPHNTNNEFRVSLPPYRTELEFPIFIKPGQPVSLSFLTKSLLPGASFETESVWVKTFKVKPDQDAFLQK